MKRFMAWICRTFGHSCNGFNYEPQSPYVEVICSRCDTTQRIQVADAPKWVRDGVRRINQRGEA